MKKVISNVNIEFWWVSISKDNCTYYYGMVDGNFNYVYRGFNLKTYEFYELIVEII